MKEFIKDIQLRWSDLDPNFHLRHSIYYDWGALCRIEFLKEFDLNAHIMQQLHFGPLLLRVECVLKREVRDGDKITVVLTSLRAKRDDSRWSIRHQIMKDGDTVAA